MPRFLLPIALLFCVAPLCSQTITVPSPDANMVFTFSIGDTPDEQGRLFYSVTHKNMPVVLRSRLGIITVDLPDWTTGFTLTGATRRSQDTVWKPVYGERSRVRDNYNECTISLIRDRDTNNAFQVVARVYNEGVAFCYHYPQNLSTSVLHIKDEATEFAFEQGTMAHVTPFAQELYHLRPLTGWTYGPEFPLPQYAARTPDYESERPLTLVLPNGLYAVIGEARLVDYARMKLTISPDKKHTIVARLFGPVTESSPFSTPWRVIMVAESPGALLEHNDIFLNLNAPCEIQNTSWIKPGRVMREVTLSTAGAEACIHFCAQHKIEYVEFDAGWYGYEYSKASDASRVDVDPRRNPRKDLDLPRIIAYAKENNVGVFLYVNHRAMEKQIDDIFPLYQKWGIAGLKFGFVHVGSHKWTSWVHEAVRKAARYNLLVDIHDEYRPTGYSRTYPNLLTQEGIRGNECMPDANHNTTMPFTRFLAGPADYTICYYHQAGLKPNINPIKTTSAHQLALSVIFYSPLQFVFWYDKPSDYHGEPEVEFFDHLPTVWDTTKVLLGEIGKYAAIARKRDDTWFVGAITNNDGRRLSMPLEFLDSGKHYTATLYMDGGQETKTRTRVRVEERPVTARSVIDAVLQPSGGVAMEIRPVESQGR